MCDVYKNGYELSHRTRTEKSSGQVRWSFLLGIRQINVVFILSLLPFCRSKRSYQLWCAIVGSKHKRRILFEIRSATLHHARVFFRSYPLRV